MNDIQDLTEKHSRLTRELDEWRQKEAIAKADEARLKKEITEALSNLKAEFGCSSYEEAVNLRDSLLEEATTLLDELEEKLASLRSN